MTIQEIILAGGGVALGAALVWFFNRRSSPDAGEATQLRDHIQERFDHISTTIDRRLQENIRAMNESKSFLADRVSHTERSVREVTNTLSKLEHATVALKASTDEISSFQNLLKS